MNPANFKQTKIFDPIFKFIDIEALMNVFVRSLPFERLRYVAQLGTVPYVFPSASHSRYVHSLGVMYLTGVIVDKIMSDKVFQEASNLQAEDVRYWRFVARLGGLLHDVGHMAYSHVFEKEILSKNGHEEWTYLIITSHALKEEFEFAAKQLGVTSKKLIQDVLKIALGKEKIRALNLTIEFTEFDGLISQVVSNDNFGSDRLEYLLRDALFTGLPYGTFDYHQLIDSLVVIETADGCMEIGIEENGMVAMQALLIARSQMYMRLYQYNKVIEYTHCLGQIKKHFYLSTGALESVDMYLGVIDADIDKELFQARKDPKHPCHNEARMIFGEIDRIVAQSLPITTTAKDITDFKEKFGMEERDLTFTKVNFRDKSDLTCPVKDRRGNIEKIDFSKQFCFSRETGKWVIGLPDNVEKFLKYIGQS